MRSYYAIVKLSKNIKSENKINQVVGMNYEVSRSWAYRHFDDVKSLMTSNEKEKYWLEIWYIKEENNVIQFEVLDSWKSAWFRQAI